MESSFPSPQPVCGADLDALTGEVLPGRTALSLATAGMTGPTGQTPAPSGYTAGDGHGGTVYYACQTESSPGSQGLIGALGLGYAPYSSTTCVPAAVTGP